jgi:hypothetical protein
MAPNMSADTFETDKIGLACYLIITGQKLISVNPKHRGRASFTFALSPKDAASMELAYTTSDHARFFEAFRYLRDRTLRGN